jgi:homoserine O-acetyltransferase/O-succinyltransferase
MKRLLCAAGLVFLALAALADDGSLRVASLGDFELENGQAIRDCRIGYRTYGVLAADRSNAIVLTTWFAGSSAGYASWVGPGKLFDSSKYFVIVIDALGDSVSSSPSNSSVQPGAQFPQFTMRDMVRSQHELLTRELGLDHVYAVSGLSMGGMQTFQWVFAYPDYMDKAVPIVGTPKQTSYDLLLWKSELDLLESMRDVPGGAARAMNTVADIQAMGLQTPAYIAARVKPETISDFMTEHRKVLGKLDPFDYASQLRAMIALDVYRDFGGSAEAAAKAIKAKMLVITSLQDHMVNPAPARGLARLARAETVALSGDCGHLATGCEKDVLQHEVWRFLARP